MQKLKIMLIPMCIGTILLLFSWYMSYPVSIDSPYAFEYDHISCLYWLSLPILFASFFIVAIETKNNTLRWIMTVGTVLLMYSMAYFYYRIPGSDAHQFRSLTEYFISTGDLSLKPYHEYYQWPLFFILNDIAISIMGLDLRYFEFILYGTIGLVITSFLYLYASKARANGYLAVIAFFIILRNFFNYQWAPFSLSTGLLLALITLDSYMSRKREWTIATLIIFTNITLTHVFTPLFFIIYCFFMYIINKNEKYLKLFILTLTIYWVYNYNQIQYYIGKITNIYTLEYIKKMQATLASSVAPQPYIDIIAQSFSRTVIVITTIVTGFGFILLLMRRKFRRADHAILLTGILYSAMGSMLYVLGLRAFFLTLTPASLGASYLSKIKFKRYFKATFFILLMLFTSVLIHSTFYDQQIFFQTKEEYQCANFMVENINWNTPNWILSHFRFMQYLGKKSCSEDAIFTSDSSAENLQDINRYNYVAYTIGLGKSFLRFGHSVEKSYTIFETNHFNLIYNSGDFSYIFSRAQKK